MKLAKRLALKTSPEISNKDLRALVEAHFAAVKGCLVAETGKVVRQEVN